MKRKATPLMSFLAIVLAAVFGSFTTSVNSVSAAAGGDARTMVVAIPKVASTFDIFQMSPGMETRSHMPIYDSLVTKDADGRIVPLLAERFEVSDDAKTYTFYLRKGVKFSDGSEFTAHDAKYSIERTKAGQFTDFHYTALESAEVIDDYTFRMNLNKPSLSMLDILAAPMYALIVSKAAYEKYGDAYGSSLDKIVGTGPYKVTEWKPGELVAYQARDDYFRGAPNVKKATLKTITDVNAAVIALQTGELDAYFDDIPGMTYNMVKRAPNVNLVDYASTIFYGVFLNNETGMFTDARLRQAVGYAVDRQQMVMVGSEGMGTIADYIGDRTSYTEGDPQIKGIWYKQDLEKARQLVAEAGFQGKPVTIKTYATDPYPKLATVLQDSLNKIGLKAEVRQMERAALIDECSVRGEFEAMIVRWVHDTEDMDEIIYGSLHSDSFGPPGNWSRYINPEMDRIVIAAKSEKDPVKRRDLYRQAIELFVKDAVYIPLYYPHGSRAYTKDLKIDDGNVRYDQFYYYSWAK